MMQIKKFNSEWAEDVKRNWEKSLPKFTDALLVESFADGIVDLDDKLAELKNKVTEITNVILDIGKPYFRRTDPDAIFIQQVIKYWHIPDLIAVEEDIRFIERLQKRIKDPSKKALDELTDNEIDTARSVSIVELAKGYISNLKKQGKNYSGCCPFHNDRTPSLVLYTDSNRFYCFGCLANGDAIAFAQQVLQLDFKATVTYLLNH